MSLDLARTLAQIEALARRTGEARREREERLGRALQALREAEGPEVNARMESASGLPFAPAGWAEERWRPYPLPPVPPEFCVLATDGSHIDVDRHLPLRCYLINIGHALLRYGPTPDARLFSTPTLYGSQEDLYLTDGVEEVPVEGPLLGAKRMVEEVKALARLAGETPPGLPTLALLDGSLVLWEIRSEPPPTGRYPAFVRRALLEEGLLPALDTLRGKAPTPLAVASYISRPNNREVVHSLRLLLCPSPSTRPHTGERGPRSRCPCDDLREFTDRDLMARLLGPGERSPLFSVSSTFVRKHYGEHRVYFFYLNAGEEVARAEVPEWVARDPALLSLVHALLVDGARRGGGYPVALMEAHEQAVLTARDREEFRALLERSLLGHGLPIDTSEKRRSKRVRGV